MSSLGYHVKVRVIPPVHSAANHRGGESELMNDIQGGQFDGKWYQSSREIHYYVYPGFERYGRSSVVLPSYQIQC